MTRYYRRVDFDQNGEPVEVAEFLGVQSSAWDRFDMPSPDAAFVRAVEVDFAITVLRQIADNGAIGLAQHDETRTLQEIIAYARMALSRVERQGEER